MATLIRRRRFIVTLGSAAAWPLGVRAQQPANLPTIGFLVAGTPSSHGRWAAALVQRLRELGWIEGRTIAIEYRWAEGSRERAAEIAAEFVRLKVDVIVTSATVVVIAAKQATSVIPIVFAAASDPVGTGLVASLARPGGNVTGLSLQFTDLAGKRLELVRVVLPDLRRLAILANASSPATALEVAEVQAMARTFGLEVAAPEVRQTEDIAPAFEALKGRVEALYVVNDPLVDTNRVRINTLALAAITDAARRPGARRSGWPDVLWSELHGPVPARRRPCRQNFARGEAGRHPGRAADQIRSCHQPDHRAGARDHHPADASRARRRGDRVSLLMSGWHELTVRLRRR
jgi:putative tryptophan/tyrosine transport system substrate-binding protein